MDMYNDGGTKLLTRIVEAAPYQCLRAATTAVPTSPQPDGGTLDVRRPRPPGQFWLCRDMPVNQLCHFRITRTAVSTSPVSEPRPRTHSDRTCATSLSRMLP